MSVDVHTSLKVRERNKESHACHKAVGLPCQTNLGFSNVTAVLICVLSEIFAYTTNM